jgi:hypothetical protein
MHLHNIVSRLATLPDPASIPVQEFQVGQRVKCSVFTGTVTAYMPQTYTDNLYRVAWDGDAADNDLYPAANLTAGDEIGRVA